MTPPRAPSAAMKETPGSPPTPPRTPSPALNIGLTVVFVVLGGILVLALILPALFLVMASDACGDNCTVQEIGFYWALVTPSLAWLATLVTSIVLLVRKLRAWLLSLIGFVVIGLTFMLGVAIVFAPLP